MKLSFDAMLMAALPGVFVAESGKNKGQEYPYTTLTFNCEGVDFQLSARGAVAIDPAYLRVDRHWDLDVEPKKKSGAASFRVLKIAGSALSKVKAA